MGARLMHMACVGTVQARTDSCIDKPAPTNHACNRG
jgi:hypothetical protein